MSTEDDLGALSPDAPQSDPDAVMLYGSALVDRLTYISSIFSSLVMSVGRAARDDRDVLVPFVEVKFEGPTGQDDPVSKSFFSELVPLENIVFVLEDISNDLTTVCQHFSAVARRCCSPSFQPSPSSRARRQDALRRAFIGQLCATDARPLHLIIEEWLAAAPHLSAVGPDFEICDKYNAGTSGVTRGTDPVKEVHRLLGRGYTDVVDADLSKYFDTIPHSELLKSVARRIVDRHVLRLIRMWLKAPISALLVNG
ncbi:hypothetical protein [Bradyrhizobium sp. 142]|uniref:hypothetical protein n=1 Tax=Bradyrhizobium sp. 142 TaxID=2782618 RepID=UPI001FFBB698|nr:hypothetical protein [Bradyrhizobium sp. 142]